MRLIRSLLVLYHASMALRHTRLSAHHVARADALLSRSRGKGMCVTPTPSGGRKGVAVMAIPSNARGRPDGCGHHGHTSRLDPVALILLGSIVGLGICTLWVWIVARSSL